MVSLFEQMVSRYEIKSSNDKLHAVREVLQEITLSALYRAGFFSRAAFYGGTCLRIFHGLPRYSEDMDFSLLDKNEMFSLNEYIPMLEDEFRAYGRKIEISRKSKTIHTTIESAFIKDTTEIANLSFQTEPSIKIKLEVDKDPPLPFRIENKLLLLPFSLFTPCFDIPCLFAGKIHAFLFRSWKTRVKGRDWFDLEWYVRNDHPVDFDHLKARALQAGYTGSEEFTPELVRELVREKITRTKISRVIDDVRPFVQQPDDLKIWSEEYFLNIAERIRFSSAQ
jgi:predicted nucleotidyltransferase component of viral defense system